MPSKVKQDSNEQLKSPDYQFSAASEFLRHCLQLKKCWMQTEVFKSSKIASKTAQIDKTSLGKNRLTLKTMVTSMYRSKLVIIDYE